MIEDALMMALALAVIGGLWACGTVPDDDGGPGQIEEESPSPRRHLLDDHPSVGSLPGPLFAHATPLPEWPEYCEESQRIFTLEELGID